MTGAHGTGSRKASGRTAQSRTGVHVPPLVVGRPRDKPETSDAC
jgi:hypothetical protein